MLDAVDQALVVASKRLLPDIARAECDLADEIRYGLDELRKLPRGESPDYDNPSVALCYSHKYHAEQTNLAYFVYSNLFETTSWLENRAQDEDLIVIDFGSGTRAGSFGLAFALAELMPNIAQPDSLNVVVAPYDVSEMNHCGHVLWDSLVKVCSERTSLHSLETATQAIHHVTQAPNVGDAPTWGHVGSVLNEIGTFSCTTWLTAFHAFYEDGARLAQSALVDLHGQFKFDSVIVTTQDFKAPIARKIVRPLARTMHQSEQRIDHLPLEGKLPRIANFRKGLLSSFRQSCDAYGLGYLLDEMFWQAPHRKSKPHVFTLRAERNGR